MRLSVMALKWLAGVRGALAGCIALVIGVLCIGAGDAEALGAGCEAEAVEVTAVVAQTPPSITLSWPGEHLKTVKIQRKLRADAAWGPAVKIADGTAKWVDREVAVGALYEYHVQGVYYDSKIGCGANGYICSGIRVPAEDHHGTVLVMVDQTMAAPLERELAQLKEDLVGDGWSVSRHDVPRHTGTFRTQFGAIGTTDPGDVETVKKLILKDYAAAKGEVRAVFLLGHVPVPYAGFFTADGHAEHLGAWPADVYYGDMTGKWTDTAKQGSNVPGDGRFDQSMVPGKVELGIGRVDLSDLPQFKAPEVELLRNYLKKDHAHRMAKHVLPRRATVYDRFWDTGIMEGFGTSAYRAWPGLVGSENIKYGDLNLASTDEYLCGFIADSGRMDGAGGVSTGDFAKKDYKIAFYLSFGSWFGDWNSTDNFLRAALATESYGLVNAWSGRPSWFVHPLGMGAAWGEVAKLTQNNAIYEPAGAHVRGVHVALMGDPTLRVFSVLPPGDVTATRDAGKVLLKWKASADAGLGYRIFRAAKADGPFKRVGMTTEKVLNWSDPAPLAKAWYQVKAVKLETTPSGTFENVSEASTVGP